MRARIAALSIVVCGAAATARADAIGPVPIAGDCAIGSTSTVVGMMTHAQSAYCGIQLCREGDDCGPGRACGVVELEVRERWIAGAGGTGAGYAEVVAACDAPDDAAVIERPRRGASDEVVFFQGTPTSQAPAGCQRLRVCAAGLPAAAVSAPAPVPARTPITHEPEPTAPARPAPATCACSASGPRSPRGALLVLALVLAQLTWRVRPAQ